jgi:tetratricopeptide (TPR) repeat protein
LTDRRGLGVLDPLLVKTETITGVSKAAGVEILQDLKLADNQDDLQWIADRVDGHVLMLKILAGVSKGRGYLRQHPELVQTQAATVLRSQLNRLSPMAQGLLLRLAVLRMPIDSQGLTFLRLCPDALAQDDRFEMAVLSAEPIDFLPEELNETANLLQNLIGMSLVQSSYNEAAREEFYDLHPVIRQFLQGEYKTRMPELMTIAYKFYLTAIDLTAPKTREDLNPLLEAQYFAFQLKKYDEAEDLIYKAEKYLEPWGNWSELMELYEQILPHVKRYSQPYILQCIGMRHRDWGNWDKAEQYYREGLAIAEAVEDKGLIAGFTGHLGSIERNRGNWDAAESLYRQSLQMSQELGDHSGMASSWGLLGDIERNRGNWDAAESLYQQSLQMSQKLSDRHFVAAIQGCLGEVAIERENWDIAEDFLKQSLQTFEDLGDRYKIAECCKDRGIMETQRGQNYDLAQTYLRRALDLYREINYPVGIANVLEAFGNLRLAQGDWSGAEDNYFSAVEIREEILPPDHPSMADIWLGYGRAQLGKAKMITSYYPQALKYCHRALLIYEKRLGTAHYKTQAAQALVDQITQILAAPEKIRDTFDDLSF